MFAMLKVLALQWMAARALLAGIGSLGVLLPVALGLKWIGLPVLGVLGVVSLPLVIALLVVGLPVYLVFSVGGGVLGFLFVGLTVGVMAMVMALPIIIPIWLTVKLVKWALRAGKAKERSEAEVTAAG